jgi:hypothetical protein
MTTTSGFQIKPDYYNSKEECSENSKKKIQTNTRYKNFYQTHFTAGDEEQFIEYKYEKNGSCDTIDDTNIFHQIWDGYHNLETSVVINTFRYIFNKFKKGIFVKILNNELKVFLPFSNANFINEWSDNIKINSNDIFKYVSEVEGYKFNEKNVNDFKNTWYANNCLLRYEYPIYEGDTNVSNVKNMLEELCEKRKIPDIEFFLNRRDFPILTKNNSEPYYDLWDSYNHPLVSHNYDKYIPILSMSKTNLFADILIPTHEDWSRIQSVENKWFCKSYRSCDEYNFEVSWEDKKNIAVFRGSSTGSGVTIDTNQRLKIAHLSYLKKIDENDNLPYLDAGITKWNLRIKKLMKSPELKVIDIHSLPFGLVPFMTIEEQCKHKYIIHVDGHVSAFRLSLELNMGSVILLVDSEWKVWYSELLKPFVHYVPISKDLSDIYDKIKWCKSNDEKCKKIVSNAKKFYEMYLQKDGVLDYMQKLLCDIKKQTGNYYYNEISPLTLQLENEEEIIKEYYSFPKMSKIIEKITLPKLDRCHGLLKGIHNLLNYFKSNGKLDEILSKDDNIFKNKNINIQKYSFKTDSSFSFVLKSASNEKKVKENIHETFVGLTCTNELLKKIPNFSYVFGIDDKNRLITEHIDGRIFLEYIKSDEFNIDEYIFILLQICLTLHVAQSHCGFIHYDLTTWNIIIQRFENEVDIEYVIDDKIIIVRTNIIPILIDYGKSSVIHNFEHHCFVNMYKYSTCQDIISILVTSLYQILTDKNITKTEFNDILKIANFLSKTGYRKNVFFNSRDLKSFLRNAKKYSNILNDNKYELEKLKPMDLFKFLTEKFNKLKCRFTIKNNVNFSSFMDKSNPIQVFYYSLAQNDKEVINSYISTLKSMKKSSIHDINLLINDIYKVYGKELYKSVVKNVLNNAAKYIKIENKNVKEELNKFKYRKIIYDENIFTEPTKLLNLLENNIDIIQNISKFKITDEYNDKLIMFVNINTLIQIAKLMYKKKNLYKDKENIINVYNFIYKIELYV